MNIAEFFNQNPNYSTEFSKDIKDYRILTEHYLVDEYEESEGYEGCYDEFKGKGYYVITADREIPFNNLYYWLGDLIVDKSKDNKIIDGIAFN